MQVDDTCARKIKLTYPAYDSGYSAINGGAKPQFSITLTRGVSYNLSVYLQLADGYDMVLWSHTYTAQLGESISWINKNLHVYNKMRLHYAITCYRLWCASFARVIDQIPSVYKYFSVDLPSTVFCVSTLGILLFTKAKTFFLSLARVYYL